MVLYETYQDARWFNQWPEDFAKREKQVLRSFSLEHEREIAIWKVLQYFFALQWDAFKRYVNAKRIQLVGDVPIFVAADSADTWSNLHLFKTDEEGHFSAVSGVPQISLVQLGNFGGILSMTGMFLKLRVTSGGSSDWNDCLP